MFDEIVFEAGTANTNQIHKIKLMSIEVALTNTNPHYKNLTKRFKIVTSIVNAFQISSYFVI